MSFGRSHKLLFACLYLSEGAPIGFLWLALPTRLKAEGVELEQISGLAAVLVLPWTFKFAWAPLIDVLRSRWWTLRHWIIAAQLLMGLTLCPLLILNPADQFSLLTVFLVAHAAAAATQDVAIDALCISSVPAGARGEINGWMQTGMLIGRSALGGGALVAAPYTGWPVIVICLIVVTVFSGGMLLVIRPPEHPSAASSEPQTKSGTTSALKAVLADPAAWAGILFALTGGACFKALEVLYGPFLIDRGFTEAEVGAIGALPMIGLMIAGSLSGGILSYRFGRKPLVVSTIILISSAVALMFSLDMTFDLLRSPVLPCCLAVAAFGIGLFTSCSYALFMDITHRRLAGAQYSAFMGMTNGCESWTVFTAGQLISAHGYALPMISFCGVSLCSLLLLKQMTPADRRPRTESQVVP